MEHNKTKKGKNSLTSLKTKIKKTLNKNNQKKIQKIIIKIHEEIKKSITNNDGKITSDIYMLKATDELKKLCIEHSRTPEGLNFIRNAFANFKYNEHEINIIDFSNKIGKKTDNSLKLKRWPFHKNMKSNLTKNVYFTYCLNNNLIEFSSSNKGKFYLNGNKKLKMIECPNANEIQYSKSKLLKEKDIKKSKECSLIEIDSRETKYKPSKINCCQIL